VRPLGGEIYEVGSRVAIYWSGGANTISKVGIYLVNNTSWKVVIDIGAKA
jgi:hypothetical protein